jgi:ribosomal protein S18 acetylase RimI-like enzyme
MPEFPTSETELEMVQEADAEELSRLLSLAFGDSHYHAVDRLIDAIRRPDCRYYFARVYRERVGQIGVVTTPRGAYIRGVGIVPERRRQGLGRQLLALTVAQMVSEGYHDLSLDAAFTRRWCTTTIPYRLCELTEYRGSCRTGGSRC